MRSLLRMTAVGRLVSAYKYVQFNGPGVVKFSGAGLILVIGLIHLSQVPRHYEAAPYMGVLFGLLFAGSLLTTLGILRGFGWGWPLGSVLSGVAFAAYFVSRVWGLPGFPEVEGNWANPVGTVAFGLEALFVSLHFSTITGMNVAYPDERDWYD